MRKAEGSVGCASGRQGVCSALQTAGERVGVTN